MSAVWMEALVAHEEIGQESIVRNANGEPRRRALAYIRAGGLGQRRLASRSSCVCQYEKKKDVALMTITLESLYGRVLDPDSHEVVLPTRFGDVFGERAANLAKSNLRVTLSISADPGTPWVVAGRTSGFDGQTRPL